MEINASQLWCYADWLRSKDVVFQLRQNKQSHTRVVKIHDAPDDVVNVTTFFVYDVDDVFGLGGKRQHVEIQLYIVTVQLEKKWRTWVGFLLAERGRHIN